jgi:hypothetical protein
MQLRSHVLQLPPDLETVLDTEGDSAETLLDLLRDAPAAIPDEPSRIRRPQLNQHVPPPPPLPTGESHAVRYPVPLFTLNSQTATSSSSTSNQYSSSLLPPQLYVNSVAQTGGEHVSVPHDETLRQDSLTLHRHASLPTADTAPLSRLSPAWASLCDDRAWDFDSMLSTDGVPLSFAPTAFDNGSLLPDDLLAFRSASSTEDHSLPFHQEPIETEEIPLMEPIDAELWSLIQPGRVFNPPSASTKISQPHEIYPPPTPEAQTNTAQFAEAYHMESDAASMLDTLSVSATQFPSFVEQQHPVVADRLRLALKQQQQNQLLDELTIFHQQYGVLQGEAASQSRVSHRLQPADKIQAEIAKQARMRERLHQQLYQIQQLDPHDDCTTPNSLVLDIMASVMFVCSSGQ